MTLSGGSPVVAHVFKNDHVVARIVGRPICVNCGLIRLRNLLTDWCVSKGCDFRDHPGLAQACRVLPEEHRRAAA